MPKRAIIPITNENQTTGCTRSYRVRYRVAGSPYWQPLAPDPLAQPIVIQNLEDGQTYEAEVTRVCCEGQESLPAIATFNT